MPAPCCLRWAGTLPRPPESSPPKGWCPLTRRSLGVVLRFLTCVFVIMLTVPLVFGDECALRKQVPMDGASRALLAPQVVEAVVEEVTTGSPVYEVVFRVTRVYKKYRGHGRVKKRRTVSLPFRRQFAPESPLSTAAEECLAVATLKVRRKYFLFLSGTENRRSPLQSIFPPIPSNKRAKRRIKNIVCSGCAKSPSVSRLRDDSVVRGHSVNLTCTFDGSPTPNVTWLKDGEVIYPRRNSDMRIQTKRIRIRPRTRRPRRRRRRRDNRNGEELKAQRRRKSRRKKSDGRARPVRVISTLSLRRSKDSDAGIYSCLGKSVIGEASAKAGLTVVPPLDPGIVYPCPYDSYCLNGGTCMFFKHFGEFVCQCAEGYKGQRCQEKEVFPSFRDYNCRSSLPFLTPSRGLRCPRNQPLFLWEILQQSLAAHKHKVSPWTKTHHLTWSPSRTMAGFSWPPLNSESSTLIAHQENLQNPLNFSALDFFIPNNGNRHKGHLEPIPSLESFFTLSRGLNVSQDHEHDNTSKNALSTRLNVHPTYIHSNDPLLNSSQHNNMNSLISSSRSPLLANIPKIYSGHRRKYGTGSILSERETIREVDMLPVQPSSDKSNRHHHNDHRLRRTKHKNKSLNRWPLRPPTPHPDSINRQSYIYPTSITSTTNDSDPL